MISQQLENILAKCCEEFEVTAEAVRSNSRRTELVYCRMAIVSIAKQMFDLTNSRIGQFIGRTQCDVRYLKENQSNNKYYQSSLKRIIKQIKEVNNMGVKEE